MLNQGSLSRISNGSTNSGIEIFETQTPSSLHVLETPPFCKSSMARRLSSEPRYNQSMKGSAFSWNAGCSFIYVSSAVLILIINKMVWLFVAHVKAFNYMGRHSKQKTSTQYFWKFLYILYYSSVCRNMLNNFEAWKGKPPIHYSTFFLLITSPRAKRISRRNVFRALLAVHVKMSTHKYLNPKTGNYSTRLSKSKVYITVCKNVPFEQVWGSETVPPKSPYWLLFFPWNSHISRESWEKFDFMLWWGSMLRALRTGTQIPKLEIIPPDFLC